MTQQITNPEGRARTAELGTVESLRELALREPSQGPLLGLEELRDYLDENEVVNTLATAVHVNGLAQPRRRDSIRLGSLNQAFHCGFRMGVDPHEPRIATAEQAVCLGGFRRNGTGSGRKGIFDYDYSLDLPIEDYQSNDFSLNRDGSITLSYDSPKLKMGYSSEDGSVLLSSQDLMAVLCESIGDLIVAIEQKEEAANSREALIARTAHFLRRDLSE